MRLRAVGPLGEKLGAEAQVELELPASAGAVLEAAAERYPGAARWLVRAGEPVPHVFRDGRRVAAADRVADGDVLDLVVAIAGG